MRNEDEEHRQKSTMLVKTNHHLLAVELFSNTTLTLEGQVEGVNFWARTISCGLEPERSEQEAVAIREWSCGLSTASVMATLAAPPSLTLTIPTKTS